MIELQGKTVLEESIIGEINNLKTEIKYELKIINKDIKEIKRTNARKGLAEKELREDIESIKNRQNTFFVGISTINAALIIIINYFKSIKDIFISK